MRPALNLETGHTRRSCILPVACCGMPCIYKYLTCSGCSDAVNLEKTGTCATYVADHSGCNPSTWYGHNCAKWCCLAEVRGWTDPWAGTFTRSLDVGCLHSSTSFMSPVSNNSTLLNSPAFFSYFRLPQVRHEASARLRLLKYKKIFSTRRK